MSPSPSSAALRSLARRLSLAGVAIALTFSLTAAAEAADQAQVAIGPDGDASFVWRAGSPGDGTERHIQQRNGGDDGSLAPTDSLSASGQSADDPDLAVDPAGNTIFTWVRSNGTHTVVEATRQRPNGTLTEVQTISDPSENSVEPQVAIDAHGIAIFTWQSFDGVDWIVQVRRRTLGGGLSPIRAVSAQARDAFSPQVGVDADGDAVLGWRRFNGDYWIVQARTRAADGTLGSVQNVSGRGESARSQRLAVDSAGNAVLVWDRDDGSVSTAQMRSRSADGTLGPIQDLSPAGGSATEARVTVDPDGDAVFAWQRLLPGSSDYVIEARGAAAGGALSPVQQLSALGGDAFLPEVAGDASGNAIFTWQRSNGSDFIAQARGRAADGMLSAVQDLSPAGQSAFDPQVAMDSGGGAVFTWKRPEGEGTAVETRRRTALGALGPIQALAG